MSVMASHDILPYSKFPMPRPTPPDPGLMSQFATSSLQGSTGADSIATSREDGLPPIPKPATDTFLDVFESFADPALCITPEKPTAKQRRNLQAGTSDDEADDQHTASLSLSKHKAAQRVRFDQNVEVKHMSPEYIREGNEDSPCGPIPQPAAPLSVPYSKTRSPEGKTEQIKADSLKMKAPKTSAYKVDNYMDYIEINGTADQGDSGSDLEPIQVAATDVKDITKCLSANRRLETKCKVKKPKAKIQKESDVVVSRKSPIFGQSASNSSSISPVGSMDSGSMEHVFARPEFHTTLRLSKEIRQIKQEELDLSAAVKQKLEVSGKARTQIAGKASTKLNTETSQFRSLIPVDVREDSLVQYVEREEAAKAKSARIAKPKMPEELEGREPDIMEFFTPELQRETASYSLEGLPQPQSGPNRADPTRAFDVYKHIRAWEGW